MSWAFTSKRIKYIILRALELNILNIKNNPWHISFALFALHFNKNGQQVTERLQLLDYSAMQSVMIGPSGWTHVLSFIQCIYIFKITQLIGLPKFGRKPIGMIEQKPRALEVICSLGFQIEKSWFCRLSQLTLNYQGLYNRWKTPISLVYEMGVCFLEMQGKTERRRFLLRCLLWHSI